MKGIKLPAITRPNGKVYQPRKIAIETLGNEDELTHLIIFGTHDVRFAHLRAAEAAEEIADEFYGGRYQLDVDDAGQKGWYKKTLCGFDDDTPIYYFLHNEEKGRAGVRFSVEEIELEP